MPNSTLPTAVFLPRSQPRGRGVLLGFVVGGTLALLVGLILVLAVLGKKDDKDTIGKTQDDSSDKDGTLPNRKDTDKNKAPIDQDKDKVPIGKGDRPREITNSIGMKLVRIPAGTFMMGSAEEKPQHEVELTKDFFLGVTEVTQGQWKKVMGKDNNPSYFSKTGGYKDRVKDFTEKQLDDFPVEYVSWEDVQEFVKKLSALDEEKKQKREYRLPSEAEWERACRGGAANQNYHFGDSLSPKQANFLESKLNRTQKVGSFPANAFGLHDMHGNVMEWCQDWYDRKYYAKSPIRDPLCLEEGSNRVFRGGRWDDSSGPCRSAARGGLTPESRYNSLGFRVALVPAR